MAEIIPAILPKNYEDLKDKIALVKGIVPVVQVDLCDGIFVKSLTWPFLGGGELDAHFNRIQNEQEGMPFWEEVDFELDLMVSDAVQNFDIYLKLGPRRVIFHTEGVGDLEEFKDFLEGIDKYVRDVTEIGIAFKPSMNLEQVYPLVENVDFVQFMGNEEIGHQGVELDEKVYENIKTLREKYKEIPIAVDIGVNEDTAPRLVEAGATKLVAGSAIFNAGDMYGAIERFKEL